jgi:hypothetical protein
MQPLINPEEPKKPPLADAKFAANRASAQHSTGPKTILGKQESSKNARTHCLLATGVILEVDGPNAQEEYDRLEAELWAHYQPMGVVEGIQFDKMVNAYWHDRRAMRCLDEQTVVEVTRKKRALAEKKVPGTGTSEMELSDAIKPEARLLSAAGVATVIDALQKAREILGRTGKLTEPARELLVRHLGADRLRALLGNQGATPGGTPNQNEEAVRLATKIDLELKALKQHHAELKAAEAEYEGRQVAAAGIPGKYIEKALRYGTMFERKAERARKELERAQALRRRGPMAAA